MISGQRQPARRSGNGYLRGYAAGIATEIVSALVLMVIAFLIAAAGCYLWP